MIINGRGEREGASIEGTGRHLSSVSMYNCCTCSFDPGGL